MLSDTAFRTSSRSPQEAIDRVGVRTRLNIGRAQHPTDVPRPARPMQLNRCEYFRYLCLLPNFKAPLVAPLAEPDSASPLTPLLLIIGPTHGFSFRSPWAPAPCRHSGLHRTEGHIAGKIPGLDIPSRRDGRSRPRNATASGRPPPCSSRLRASAYELDSCAVDAPTDRPNYRDRRISNVWRNPLVHQM